MLWCAFIMRSWEQLDEALLRAAEGAREIQGGTPKLAPLSPPLNAGAQIELLEALRAEVCGVERPDWTCIAAHARGLLALTRVDLDGLPTEDSALLDLFDGQRPLPRTRRAPPRKRLPKKRHRAKR
jgi:hypothetical protein